MKFIHLKPGLIFPLLFVFFSLAGHSIERNQTSGARESALANATVALPTSFAIFHNQALLSEQKYPSLAVSYSQPYAVRGFHQSQLSLIWPIYAAVLGVGCAQSSLSNYHETNLGLAISKNLSGKIAAGIMINYFDVCLPESGQHRGAFQIDGGFLYKPSEKLYLGLHFQNIAQSRLETFQYHMTFPARIRAGLSYRLTDQLLLAGESRIELWSEVGFRIGLEYQILNSFWIRGGLSSNTFQHSFGFGYALRKFQVDFTIVHHVILGFTPVFAINLNLGQ